MPIPPPDWSAVLEVLEEREANWRRKVGLPPVRNSAWVRRRQLTHFEGSPDSVKRLTPQQFSKLVQGLIDEYFS